MSITKIWVSRINNLSAARCAAVYADALLFDFREESSFCISPLQVMDFIPWLAGPQKWAWFNLLQEDQIQGKITLLGLDGVLLPIEQFDETSLPITWEIALHRNNLLAAHGRLAALDNLNKIWITCDEDLSLSEIQTILKDGRTPIIEMSSFNPDKIRFFDRYDGEIELALMAPPEDKAGMADLQELQDWLEFTSELRDLRR